MYPSVRRGVGLRGEAARRVEAVSDGGELLEEGHRQTDRQSAFGKSDLFHTTSRGAGTHTGFKMIPGMEMVRHSRPGAPSSRPLCVLVGIALHAG